MNNVKYYPINIPTQRGIIELKDIVPGDYVFEYKSSEPIKVIDIPKPTKSKIYKVTYSDGTTQYVNDSDYIYTGTSIVPVYSVSTDTTFNDIRCYPIKYNNKVYSPLDPDPYIAGAFLIYGDYEDEFINLPSYMTGINEVFAHKYSVEYDMDHINDVSKMYFKRIGDIDNKTITWKEFFNGEDINKIIPNKYAYASIKDRVQFIRGVFDTGYLLKIFRDDTVGIVNKSEERLKELQKILYSLGIISKVSYDTAIDPGNNNNYKLEIGGMHHGYPGFTYLINNIEHLLKCDNELISYIPPFSISLNKISLMYDISSSDRKGYVGNLILEKPNIMYVADNFLPRISL